MATIRRDFEILGVRLGVETDSAALVGRLDRSLGRFASPEPAARVIGIDLRRRVADLDGERVPLHPGAVLDQAFGLVYRSVLDRVERFLVLHAAAVARDGRALLLAAPSGSGKTTLTLAMLERGFELLSDDFAPMERASGLIHPFPKTPRIRPGPGQRLGLARPRLALSPAAPAAIVMFDGGRRPPAPEDPVEMTVTVAGDLRGLVEALAVVPGVTRVAVEGEGRELRLRVEPAKGGATGLERVLGGDPRVLEYGGAGRPPRPGSRPLLRRLPMSSALVPLLREVQNRRPGGALWTSTGGDPLRLAAELGGFIAGARAYWLAAGRPRETAARLSRLLS